MYSLSPRDVDWFRQGMVSALYVNLIGETNGCVAFSVFTLCRLRCVLWMCMCTESPAITQRNSLLCEIHIIDIERTEILTQCLNHGGSYLGTLKIMILI